MWIGFFVIYCVDHVSKTVESFKGMLTPGKNMAIALLFLCNLVSRGPFFMSGPDNRCVSLCLTVTVCIRVMYIRQAHTRGSIPCVFSAGLHPVVDQHRM